MNNRINIEGKAGDSQADLSGENGQDFGSLKFTPYQRKALLPLLQGS